MFGALVGTISKILIFFYGLTGSYWLAIVVLTVFIKAILHPLTRKQLKSMKAMQVLAPKMEEIRRKFKDNPQEMNREVMQLYRAHGVNPFSGCLPMIVQMPILWALFATLNRQGVFGDASFLWWRLDFVPGFAEILKDPRLIIIPLLVGLSTYWQQMMTITDPQQAKMFVLMPIMVAYFGLVVPIGVSLYWIVSTLVYIGEYYLVVGRPGSPVAAVKSPASATPPAPPAPPAPSGKPPVKPAKSNPSKGAKRA